MVGGRAEDAAVVVVDGDGEGLLRLVLADDVLVEKGLDFAGGGSFFAEERARAARLRVLLARDFCAGASSGTPRTCSQTSSHMLFMWKAQLSQTYSSDCLS